MIVREEHDGILTLRLAHGKASAFDLELVEALTSELDRIAGSDARAVVLTGTGTIFSAGVDLYRVVDGGADYVERFLPGLAGALASLFALPKPVVAAVNGHAIAGGCILVAASDYRVMARGTGRIGVPELLVGVPFPAMALEIVRFASSPQHVQEIVYTGATYTPEAALERGLVDEVVDAESLVDRAFEVARRLADLPPRAFVATKRHLRREALERASSIGAASDAEAREIWAAPETRERVRAYLARTVGKKQSPAAL